MTKKAKKTKRTKKAKTVAAEPVAELEPVVTKPVTVWASPYDDEKPAAFAKRLRELESLNPQKPLGRGSPFFKLQVAGFGKPNGVKIWYGIHSPVLFFQIRHNDLTERAGLVQRLVDVVETAPSFEAAVASTIGRINGSWRIAQAVRTREAKKTEPKTERGQKLSAFDRLYNGLLQRFGEAKQTGEGAAIHCLELQGRAAVEDATQADADAEAS